ncbi:uncharacterized protein RJT20DRAFT_125378 [Scheffersomyces xylosifermentans]|uniref:uncharacterized protein n=1 Tax=Scheffersomyces xylosifermentans TaxID=1304137 RepID=UPI00315C89B4
MLKFNRMALVRAGTIIRPGTFNRSSVLLLNSYSSKTNITTDKKPSPPNNFINNNIVVNSLNFVKTVDDQQKALENAATSDKIHQLLTHIATNEELLYMLSLFHYECKKLNITNVNVAGRSKSLKFSINYFLRLKPINESFWEICHLMNFSNHKHRLSYNVKDLGLLDPKNFDDDVYNQLQTGIYEGTDFRHVESVSLTRPDFEKS